MTNNARHLASVQGARLAGSLAGAMFLLTACAGPAGTPTTSAPPTQSATYCGFLQLNGRLAATVDTAHGNLVCTTEDRTHGKLLRAEIMNKPIRRLDLQQVPSRPSAMLGVLMKLPVAGSIRLSQLVGDALSTYLGSAPSRRIDIDAADRGASSYTYLEGFANTAPKDPVINVIGVIGLKMITDREVLLVADLYAVHAGVSDDQLQEPLRRIVEKDFPLIDIKQ